MSTTKLSIVPCLILLFAVFTDISVAVRKIPIHAKRQNADQKALETSPLNYAALAGDTVTLECRVDIAPPTSRVMWGEFITNTGGSIISDNNQILDHPNSDRYRIVQFSPRQFDLEIRDVSFSDGGKYVCQDTLSGPPNVFRGEAEIVVLDAHPNCTTTAPADGRVLLGQYYTIECIIHYQGQYPPSFHWSGPPGFTVGNSPPNPTTVWSGIAYNVTKEMNTRAFEVLTNFTDIGSVPVDHASNTPDWSHVNRFNQIFVNWGPMNIEANPLKPAYAVGDQITCTADANPPASFQWQNMRTFALTQGPVFTITENMVGFNDTLRCHAENEIGGFVYSENLFISAYTPAPTSPTTATTTTQGPTLPAFGPCRDVSGRWVSTSPYAEMILEVVQDSEIGEVRGIMKNQTDTVWVEMIGTVRRGDYLYIGLTAIWPFNDGITGMAGECHSCSGNEVILSESLWRAKANSVGCGIGSPSSPDAEYGFNKVGSSAILREQEFDVYRPTKEVSGKLGIKLRKRK